MYISEDLSSSFFALLAYAMTVYSHKQVQGGDCDGIISLTYWTELTLHIIDAVLRLNELIPRGLLHGTRSLRKPR
jgi:hypothetical protein